MWQKNYLYLYLFEELVACARMLLLRPDPGSASEGGRSRPETPQGNTQVSLVMVVMMMMMMVVVVMVVMVETPQGNTQVT